MHDAGLGVAREDRPLDRRRAPPARQQREVQVHEPVRQRVEQRGREQLPERDHHAERRRPIARTSSTTSPRLRGRAHRRGRARRGRLHRARHRCSLAAAAPAVGLGDDERDVVPGRVQRAQRRHRVGGRAEEDDAHRDRRRLATGRGRGPMRGRRPGGSAARGCACSRSASRRTSGSTRSSSSTPSRWSISCWNIRPSSSSPSSTTSLPSRSRPRIVTTLRAHDLEAEAGHREAALLVEPLAVASTISGLMSTCGTVALVQVEGEQPLAARRPAERRGRRPPRSIVSYMPCDERSRGRPSMSCRRRGRAASARGHRRGAAGTCLQATRRGAVQTRRGSTSTRRRPLARAASTPDTASASQSAANDGARSSARVEPDVPSATGPSTVTPASATASHGGGDRLGAASHLGQSAERREAERLTARGLGGDDPQGSPWLAACTTSCSGSRVCRRRRPRPSSGVPQQPGAADEQPQRLLGGPGPRREQLLVELQVRDQRRRAAHRTRCSTASVPMSTGDVGHLVGGGVDRPPRRSAAAAPRGRRARG